MTERGLNKYSAHRPVAGRLFMTNEAKPIQMKKFLKIIGLIILVIILIPLLFLGYKYVAGKLYMGGEDEANITYLNDHKYVFSGNSSDAIPVFDETFYNNKVFMLGENHGFAAVQKIDELLFKHLNQKIGLRYYIGEMDSIRAKRLTQFLSAETKDTALLAQVVRDIKIRIPQQSSVELYQKWMNMYDYNQTLPDSLKLEVLGIDISFDGAKSAFRRDSAMMLNFLRIVEKRKLQNEQFYGLFGFAHAMQDGIEERNNYYLAAKLKRAAPPYNQVQSIVCYNIDSEMYMPKNDQFPTPEDEKIPLANHNGPIAMVKGIKDLVAASNKNENTLFKLNGKESPYDKSQLLAGIKVDFLGSDVLPHDANKATTAYFQYAILLRNSEALTPFD